MMAVYKGSRYKGSYVYADDQNRDIIYLDLIQEYKFLPSKEDLMIEFKQRDRLDLLAQELYGDPALEWVILQANPQYDSPLDIRPGDVINVPLPEKVSDIIE
jgi:hypothetical protein